MEAMEKTYTWKRPAKGKDTTKGTSGEQVWFFWMSGEIQCVRVWAEELR